MLSEIFAESDEFKTFLSQVRENKQEHSYLLVSKDGFSSLEMATLFAKAILCQNLCGTCENCKKIELKAHPDVKYFPQGDKLLVDDSKKIVDESFTKPIFADKKIFIISNFDNSTQEAQNKLLKSLEEPNDNIYYILTTSNIEKVLPTIRSRCNKIYLSQISEQTIAKMLKCDEATKNLAIKIGGGYLSKSIELSKKKNLAYLTSLAVGLIQDLKSSSMAIEWVKKIIDVKEDVNLLIEIISLVLEDAINLKVNKAAEIRLEDYKAQIEKISAELSLKCLSKLALSLNRAVRDLSYNVGIALVADNLVMEILEVKYLCK